MDNKNLQPDPSSQSKNSNSEFPIESSYQNDGSVNGLPLSNLSTWENHTEPEIVPKHQSKWRHLFAVLGIMQAIGVALFLVVMLWASQQAKSGVSGTEFIAMLLFITVVPVISAISLVNLVGLPIYLKKNKPGGKYLKLSIISLVLSALLVMYGAYNIYGLTVYPKRLAEESRQNIESNQRKFATSKVEPEITRQYAISFMESCKADYFVGYSDINLIKEDSTKAWLNKAERSRSGVEISENAPKSYVFASKAMTIELQDTARHFRQSCYQTKKLYIAIDDWMETEYPLGTWTKVKK